MLELGSMFVEEYYPKFIDLMIFTSEIAPTKDAKASRFELGLTLDLQGRLEGDTFTLLDHVFGKHSYLYAIRKREEGGKQGEKQKENPNLEVQRFEKKHHGTRITKLPKETSTRDPTTITLTTITPTTAGLSVSTSA